MDILNIPDATIRLGVVNSTGILGRMWHVASFLSLVAEVAGTKYSTAQKKAKL